MEIKKRETFNGYEYSLVSDNEVEYSSLRIDLEIGYTEFYNIKGVYLHSFITVEKQRNKGYGKYLLKYIASQFKKQHLSICLHAFPCMSFGEGFLPMDKLVEFYKSCGFQVYKKRNINEEEPIPMILK